MSQVKQRKFNLRTKLSQVGSEASTIVDSPSITELSSKKNLFKSDSQLNLSQICLSNRKFELLSGELTSRTTADHIQIAGKIVKRFQRKPDEQNPFLKAKLKHIIKRWPNNQQQQELDQSVSNTECISKWLQPKFVTLRSVTKENVRKQVEIKKMSQSHVDFF